MNKNTHHSKSLQKAWDECGSGAFKWHIIEESTVKRKHGWGWGENMPKSLKPKDGGGFEMCRHCLLNQSNDKQ